MRSDLYHPEVFAAVSTDDLSLALHVPEAKEHQIYTSDRKQKKAEGIVSSGQRRVE